ncbi:TetR/AcrR family transcriptional regulator [Fusibacter paucivorans]|uniref:TetR/AcrR family transcriptional regulator n=1 Tax=Fusibacter paucivorans TaxID=76009 RepID=A0ABS5PQJ9_9FIRM|nr:TetR/AcrR family transcriptional regulator [Fusibacter paucivorans]MBS7527440.1 TetR/AcrR family transcriptional regulator [Fusibacter paucivorans]
MQYLKDDVRARIIDAALDEFAEKGFNNASMREIAQRAQITVGNIYRYFKNKEDLLKHCLSPLIEVIDAFVNRDYIAEMGISRHVEVREIIAVNITKLYTDFPREFYVLRNGLKGTLYNAYYDNVVQSVIAKMKRLSFSEMIAIDPMIYEIMARNQIEAIIYILEHAEPEDVERLVKQFFAVSFKVFK